MATISQTTVRVINTISLQYVPWGLVDNVAAFVQIMACRRMLVCFADAYMCHSASMSWRGSNMAPVMSRAMEHSNVYHGMLFISWNIDKYFNNYQQKITLRSSEICYISRRIQNMFYFILFRCGKDTSPYQIHSIYLPFVCRLDSL